MFITRVAWTSRLLLKSLIKAACIMMLSTKCTGSDGEEIQQVRIIRGTKRADEDARQMRVE